MPQSLILGGTKGLGRALAVHSIRRGFPTVVVGRNTADIATDFDLGAAERRRADLSRPDAFADALKGSDRFTHVFWVAGIFARRPLVETTPEGNLAMAATHLLGPVEMLKAVHRLALASAPLADRPGQPYHLVVISSTSSYRVRDNEEMYCALQAAKAHFARNWARRLATDLPGSKVTLVCPAGMRTGLFEGTGQDTSGFMDPMAVADIIWGVVLGQTDRFLPVVIERDGSTPQVSFGSPAPHEPFFR
ncbi:hypothetical protein A3C96_03805 [Candidatus Uhrbacteria bacterium RIFCSPHIGHO2_02_FULL_60_10]|uniref:Short-chain dehydrogenase n=1 Tax=Candidatus Uhrbacteria bacterium RIFCSPHIGHO2_02_FULL_60_10 TaxID=1802392 RepID=A0A1F7U826_9BACT|nr:MAG: hypothetical protein A3C96_03805 [Candidatus Uhrbacteria bacterium RIFCSPHIGHO2_02_FULL_60_10]